MTDAENLHGSTDPIGWMELVSKGIGTGTTRLPSYMDLFYLWERQQWSVADLDFSADRQHWNTDTDPVIRKQRLFGYVQFFNGEISVTDRNFDFHTVYQRKSSIQGIGVLNGGRARRSELQSLAVSGDGQPIGGPFEGIWQVAAGKIGVELATCAQVPGADPSRG